MHASFFTFFSEQTSVTRVLKRPAPGHGLGGKMKLRMPMVQNLRAHATSDLVELA